MSCLVTELACARAGLSFGKTQDENTAFLRLLGAGSGEPVRQPEAAARGSLLKRWVSNLSPHEDRLQGTSETLRRGWGLGVGGASSGTVLS